ncbi:zinc finger protein 585A-like [Myripristis murdjan]|uniref:zinc finger protein 585A-like n=1 Tax=Myripristis murdjan TaxID=586833 RepID=UPI001175F5E5|nr:zinc finger protein 585A-like [Myripristis murdjan]
MSKICSGHGNPLPLSSLRLIVPPLQLVSAALWEIVKQGAVMYYGLLEEFVTTVLETVPELLTYRQSVQLVMGLRARVVLELCRTDEFASLQTIQPHLTRINAYITKNDKQTSTSEVKASVTNFFKLVHTLVDDPRQRVVFYQKIFPTVFGPKYDSALQALMRMFLCSLQKLLPVPNLEETAHWLSLSPSILKECVEFMNQPQPLNTLIQHHKQHGHEIPNALSSSGDDCILSSLSYHLQKVDIDKADKVANSGSMCVTEDLHGHVLIGSKSKTDGTENLEEINSGSTRNDAEDRQQHVDDLSEDQGASIEVLLPNDENESDDSELDKKLFYFLQTGTGTSSKSFKCHVCGQGFSSLNKLKKHQITESVCLTHRLGKKQRQSDPNRSTSQSSFFEKINLHPKTKTGAETDVPRRGETERPLLPGTQRHNPSNLNTLRNFEQSYADQGLICRVCGKTFTYPKSFDKHQKSCLVSSKRKRRTDIKCSVSLTDFSKSRPVPKTQECLPSENETGLSNALPKDPLSSDSSEEQMCKRSSRVKTCSVCGKVFTSSNDLTRHMRCHTEQSPYLCSYCGKDFDHYEDCERHQERKCRESNQHPRQRNEFTQENTLSNTSKTNPESALSANSSAQIPSNQDALPESMQTSKLPLICQECGQGFTYYKSFEKHQSRCSQRTGRRKRRTDSNHFVIFACNFQSTDNTLETTASSETKESETTSPNQPSAGSVEGCQSKSRIIKCTMCEKNFSQIVEMKKHYSQSHQIRGSYPCPVCKRTFVRLCELVRHQQNKKLYQCSACKKCFTKLALLNIHEKAHTANVTPHICETCGKSFKNLAHLILHQKRHRDRQPCICSYCGKQFSTKDCLRAHMVRHTGGYPCPICGKKFYQRTYLKWHQYKHTGQNPYLCDTCGKGWPSAAQLKLHMVQHTEERPFKCEECGACYKRDSHLVAHRRAKHIRMRPFVCEVCSKAFRLNNELKKHMMVHTGERPFVCPRCGKTFTRKSRLREHREKACL